MSDETRRYLLLLPAPGPSGRSCPSPSTGPGWRTTAASTRPSPHAGTGS